jgi:hypothetical protein
MSDYSAGWPLWTGGGLTSPGDWELSPALLERLQAWDDLFDQHFHWDKGWRDGAARRAYHHDAPRLVRDLERELPAATVELDLWC